MHLNTVDLEDAADSGPVYLMRVEQFEVLGSLILVVAQGLAALAHIILRHRSEVMDGYFLEANACRSLRMSSRFSAAQFTKLLMCGKRVLARSVKLYSTRGGISA